MGRAYDVLHPERPVPRRVTFLIDPDGKVANVYDVADVKTHPDEVLAEIRSRA